MGDGYNQFAGFHNHPDRQTEVKEVSMFLTRKFKEDIAQTFREQDVWIRNLENKIATLEKTIEGLKAPYGRCKDGTPRAKPGMKTGQKKAVTK